MKRNQRHRKKCFIFHILINYGILKVQFVLEQILAIWQQKESFCFFWSLIYFMCNTHGGLVRFYLPFKLASWDCHTGPHGDLHGPEHFLLHGSLPILKYVFIYVNKYLLSIIWGFPGGSDGKESACNAGDPASIPGLGRSPGEGQDSPLQYSCLEKSLGPRSLAGCSLWVTKSQTWLSD